MKKTYFIFVIILLTVFSCGKKKAAVGTKPTSSAIVSSEVMKNIMVDVFLAEGAIAMSDTKHLNVNYYSKYYYNSILKKYNISNEQFQNSYQYYSANVEEMLKIMTSVIDDLSEKQSKVRNE